MNGEHRVQPQHLRREAVVYARQSSAHQLQSHAESTRLQRGLGDIARTLGWEDATVIDDDLGTSAAGYTERAGFQRMMTLVATRQAGLLLCLDASRLARNSPDWAHLFQLCGHFDTLVADLGQVYDLNIPNDRLVLGIKAVLSEMELATMRLRMRTGIESKAKRGEHRFMLPAGYEHDSAGHIVMNADRRIREAIAYVFDAFDGVSSARQLAANLADTQVRLPVRRTAGRRPIVWLIPSVNVVLKILKNPIYAGAYVWGRSRQTFSYDGDVLRKRRRRVPPSEAKVLIRDHHAAYITWDRYESNVARLADNLARWEKRMGGEGRGAARRGTALLPGLLRCGQCGRRLRVTYSPTPMYRCSGGQSAQKGRCFRLGAIGLDRAVGQQLCRALQPAALEAIVAAEELRRDEHQGRVDQAHLSVRAAQYEVDRALEQYDSVDPKNRLVAETLEERLNVRLTQLRTTQEQYERLRDSWEPLSDAQRTALRALGENFERAWNHPAADAQLKTRIVRAAIEDIIVTPSSDDSTIEVVIHWSGGTHTTCRVHRARSGRRGGPATGDLVDAVRELASYVADEDTARILNVNGYTTPRNLPWTLDRVRRFRKSHQLCLGQPDPDTFTMTTAAEYLGVANDVVRRLAQKQLFSKRQVMPYAPWRVSKAELDSPRVRTAAERLSATTKSSPDGAQLPLLDNPVH